MDVLEIQARVAWNEKVRAMVSVRQRRHTAVPGPVSGQHFVVYGSIVHDHSFDVPPFNDYI